MQCRGSSPAALAALLTSLWITACQNATSPDPVPPRDETNPVAPTANDLIVHQTLFGDSARSNSIYELIDSGDGGFYFRGTAGGQLSVGKLDALGTPLWTAAVAGARSICRVPDAAGPLANAVVVVGLSNLAENVNAAKVVVYDAAGNLLRSAVSRPAGTSVWLNQAVFCAALPGRRVFLATGNFSHQQAWPHHPYAMRFSLADDGTITQEEDRLFDDLESRSFNGVTEYSGAGTGVHFAAGNFSLDAATSDHLFSAALSDSLELVWTAEVTPSGGARAATSMGPACVLDGRAFMVATLEVAKTPPPANGGSWRAGVITAVSQQGQTEWIRLVSLTGYSETLASAVGAAGTLYAAGSCASMVNASSGRMFAYGLLARYEGATGAALPPLSCGDPHYRSGFNAVLVRGGRIYAAGWTKHYVSGGGFQSWFVEIDPGTALHQGV